MKRKLLMYAAAIILAGGKGSPHGQSDVTANFLRPPAASPILGIFEKEFSAVIVVAAPEDV
jgi:hypothetical protein